MRCLIGRAGHGEDGYFRNPFRLLPGMSRGAALDRYRSYFYGRLRTDPEFRQRIHALKGKRLGCFCKPYPCHRDIIKEYLNTFRWQNGTAQGVLVIVTEHCDPDNVLSLSFKRTSTGTYYPKWEMQYRTFGNAYRTWKEGERIEVHRNNGGSSVEIRFINSDGTTQYETTNNYFDFTLTDTRGFSDTFRVSTRKTT